MVRNTFEQMVVRLKAAGCRITEQRLAIIRYLAGREDHPGIKQVHDDLSDAGQEFSLATIYNTMEMLVSLELIKELDFDGKENRYDTNITPHINLVCTSCGSITDYPYDITINPEVLQRDRGFITSDFRLEYRGICKKCNGK